MSSGKEYAKYSQEMPPRGGFGHQQFVRPQGKKIPIGLLWGGMIGITTFGLYMYISKMRVARGIKIARVEEREQIMEDMDKFRAYRMFHNDTVNHPTWMQKIETLKNKVEAQAEADFAAASAK